MPGRSWLDRLAAVFGWGPVAEFRAVLDRYTRIGGPLLAGGLAYSALFAIVPLLILSVGITGLLINGAPDRARVVDTIASVLPPLRAFVGPVLAEAATSASTVSVLGLVALLWGGSRFLLAFEDAIARTSERPRGRGVVRRNALGIVAALVLVVIVVVGAAIAGLAAFLDAWVVSGTTEAGVSVVVRLVLETVPFGLAFLAVLLVYRFVPETRPSWRAASWPALGVALALTTVARIFVFSAPRLIGAAATIGTLATVFAALAWLGITFQAILIGAAWVVERQHQGTLSGERDGVGPAAT